MRADTSQPDPGPGPYQPSLEALVARASALVGAARATGQRRILGIAGPPGAGKSTLAGALVSAVGADAVGVPMDGYHLAQAELERLGRGDRKGAPDTFDGAGFVALLRRSRERPEATVYAPSFERTIEEPVAGSIPIRPDQPLLVVEGNYLLLDTWPWSEVRALLDEAWFVDLDRDVRVARLIARHVRYGRDPDAARAWVLRSDEANARLIEGSASRADLQVRQVAGRAVTGT
jgi:pantothenate kinase